MFDPWIGRNWADTSNMLGGRKLLIVGEAHYCRPENAHLIGHCYPSMTTETVEEWAIQKRHRFFTGLIQTIVGKPRYKMDQAVVESFWNAVIFYNYVPVFVAARARVRPTPAMFESGRTQFAGLLAQRKPEGIIVCGRDLWWWLRRGISEDASAIPAPVEACRIGIASAVRITHPSAIGFSWQKERPKVEPLLVESGQHEEQLINRCV